MMQVWVSRPTTTVEPLAAKNKNQKQDKSAFSSFICCSVSFKLTTRKQILKKYQLNIKYNVCAALFYHLREATMIFVGRCRVFIRFYMHLFILLLLYMNM